MCRKTVNNGLFFLRWKVYVGFLAKLLESFSPSFTMKSCIPLWFCIWRRSFVWLLAAVFMAGSGFLLAATSGQKALKMKLSSDRLTADVTVPEGVGCVTVQKFQRQGGWQNVITRSAVVGVMKFNLPATPKGIQWRALAWYEVEVASRAKFPARFYQGGNTFAPVNSGAGSWLGPRGLMTPGAAVDDAENGTVDEPVEADIWKVDGNTVYFFNQLRGLQVLDLTDPADPRIMASLRLPAVGQDLYVLPPDTTADRTLVLITQGWTQDAGQWTRFNMVKVSGGKTEITYTQEVAGSLADSRLVGKRLILATTEWNHADGAGSNGPSVRSRLTEWLLAPGQAPVAAGETVVEGSSPVIAAGADWLALAVHPNGQWNVSEVSVFAIRPSGLVRMAPPIRTEGAVSNKFRMQWSGNVLTTISEIRWNGSSSWSPTTVLETFRAWAPEVVHPAVVEGRLGRLELAAGESLYATRFAGNKVYVVTFLQTDPLWVVDLTDPRNPVVAGHLEVPGWSSHLEPIGDLLFSIGWDAGTVVASLFDVADPAAPALLRRVSLGAPGSFSEAMWDEQALKVLPSAGLALIPLSYHDSDSGTWRAMLQLLDIDLGARDLRLRGGIAHAFDARRADLIGHAVVSISQRVLVSADVTDRDFPTVLSEVALAWPVDRVLEAGACLLQIEDGRWYGGGRATVRVSPANAPEEILAETDLGEGIVKAADYRNGKLFILREKVPAQPIYQLRPIIGGGGGNPLVLDIYDASALPALPLLGSCSMNPPPGTQAAVDRLLWPQPDRPAVVLDYRFTCWYAGYPPILIQPAASLAEAASPVRVKPSVVVDTRPYWVPEQAPCLVLFDTTRPEAPLAESPVSLGPVGTMLNGVCEAAAGRIVLGTSCWKNMQTGRWFNAGLATQSALVIKVGTSGMPSVHPLIDLPGELFAVTDLDANGFLTFTRFASNESSTALQVCACDGFDAFLITSLNTSANVVATAGGRRLFVAQSDVVERYLLNDQGSFVTEPMLKIGWTPDSLRWIHGTLTGAKWNSLCAVNSDGTTADTWTFPAWNLGLDRMTVAADGDLLVPFGDYGAERLDR
jgi:hypothetical protein